MRINSFAKINLGLEILGKRDDGYHEIRTLFQTIDLCDRIEFHENSSPEIELTGTDSSIPWGPENLVHKAAKLIQHHFKVPSGIKIHVEKHIPPGGGLGGGSGNAAMTMLGLNEFWGLKKNPRELLPFARLLGADVAFFLTGGLGLGTGTGTEIQALPDIPPQPCLLIIPDFPISTAQIYANFRMSLTSLNKVSKIIRFLDTRVLRGLENDLEGTIFRAHPQIKNIKRLLIQRGSGLAMVSGSGSTVFGIFPSRKNSEHAGMEFKGQYRVVTAKTLPREEYWQKIYTGV